MCKAVDKTMQITGVKLVSKSKRQWSGGVSTPDA